MSHEIHKGNETKFVFFLATTKETSEQIVGTDDCRFPILKARRVLPGGQKLFQSINQIGPAKEKKNSDESELIRFLITIRKLKFSKEKRK